MKTPTIFTIVFFFLSFFTNAQQNYIEPSRATLQIEKFNEYCSIQNCLNLENGSLNQENLNDNIYLSKKIEIPLEQIESFLAFSMAWEADNWEEEIVNISVKFSGENLEDGFWQKVEVNHHLGRTDQKLVSKLMYESVQNKYVQFKIEFLEDTSADFNTMWLFFYNPGNIESSENIYATKNRNVACVCEEPAFENRLDWCPSGDCPEISNPTYTNVTHLIIHHSAGTNASSDWAGVVRSIWDYHVNSNGWSDVGYNWLVDPNGVLYQGRGDNIQGAHFCGQNGGTMGVCILGDFTNVEPTTNAIDKLTELLAWKSCDVNISPTGSSFHSSSNFDLTNISGHQDGCATECPGNSFYPLMPTVRLGVETFIEEECDEVALAAPTNLTGELINDSKIILNWEDNASEEDGFILERSINNTSNFVEIANLSANTVSYNDTDLESSTLYFYKVKAYQAEQSTEYSNAISVVTGLVAISDISINEENFILYPNPTAGNFTIKMDSEWNGNLNIDIKDIAFGKILKSILISKTTKQQEFDLSINDLPAAIYLIEINSLDFKTILKVLKYR